MFSLAALDELTVNKVDDYTRGFFRFNLHPQSGVGP